MFLRATFGVSIQCILFVVVTLAASAQTLTWTGATDANWGTASNWSPIAVPTDNDDLVFPSTATSNLSNTNNLPPIGLNSISVHRTSTAGSYTLGGTGNLVLSFLNLDNDNITSGTHAITLNLPITISAPGLTITTTANTFAALSGGILGSASSPLVFSGPGETYIGAANSYMGTTTIQSGRVDVADALSLGAATAGTTVQAGATVAFVGTLAGTTFAEPLALTGPGTSPYATLAAYSGGLGASLVTLTGAITLSGDVQVSVRNNNNTLDLQGPISGSGGLTKIVYGAQSGKLVFSGAPANTYTGTTTIQTGELQLDRNGVNDAITGPLVIGDGSHPAQVTLLQSAEIGDGVRVTVNANGTLDASAHSETLGSLDGAGSVVIGSARLLMLTTSASGAFSGVISGAGSLQVTGAGTQQLSGANSFTGGTTVSSGGLIVLGSQPASAVSLTGGTLGIASSGTVGQIVATGGTLYPGNGGSGIANCGSLALAPGVVFAAAVAGLSTGSYTDLRVTGTVDLGGANLSMISIVPTFNAPAGTAFVIIENDGVDAVTGTFAGTPEGTLVADGLNYYRVTYHGGDGNDVALVRDATSPPVVTPVSPAVGSKGKKCGLGVAPAGAAAALAFLVVRRRRRSV